MSYTPKQIAQIKAERPNLWRLSCELSKLKDPYKTIDTLSAIVRTMPRREQKEDMRV